MMRAWRGKDIASRLEKGISARGDMARKDETVPIKVGALPDVSRPLHLSIAENVGTFGQNRARLGMTIHSLEMRTL